MEFKCNGKLIFDPVPVSGSAEKMHKDYWMIINIVGDDGEDLGDYYRFLLSKRFGLRVQTSVTDREELTKYHYFGLKLQKSAWATHVSVCRGERVESWNYFKDKYNGLEVEFEYSINPRTSGLHWWLNAKCDKALDIREEMGLQREGKYGLHLTLGNPTFQFEEKNEYLHELYKNNLMNSTLEI